MGKSGIKGGYLKVQNLQAGSATVTLDANGDGTKAVTFGRNFKNIPIVLTNAQTNDDTITTNAYLRTRSGFTIHADGAAVTGTDVTVGWMAMDDSEQIV